MSSKNVILPHIHKDWSELMDYDKIRPFIKNKSQMIAIRLNPDLLKLLDQELKKDKQFGNRNEFIEYCILRYLEGKGKI